MKRLAIDLGSHTTKIYWVGSGVVLSESTCVAVEQHANGQYTIRALGDEARSLYTTADDNTHIVNPIKEGAIQNLPLMAQLLAYFLKKIELPPRKAQKVEVIFIVPVGYSSQLVAQYTELCELCHIGRGYVVPSPYAGVIEQTMTLRSHLPMFGVNIGHSKTDLAVFSADGIISGFSVNLGSGNVDAHIIDELAENYHTHVGSATAERIKIKVGSLEEDDNKKTLVDSRNMLTGQPMQISVSSPQLLDVITLYIDKLIEYIRLVLVKLPPEVSSLVVRSGMYLSGGFACMDGVQKYLSRQLGMPVHVSEYPLYSAVIGAGFIIEEDDLLYSLAQELN